MDEHTISFKVSREMRSYLREKGNVSAYLRGLVETERVGGLYENDCPFCDYLRKYGKKKVRIRGGADDRSGVGNCNEAGAGDGNGARSKCASGSS